ncbi:MAG: glycosyltransferase family 4 protein [Gaiellaceae bacterium]
MRAPRRIVVVSNDHIGSTMAGPGIRYLNFARELRSEGDVTLVVPFPTDLEPDGFELVVANPADRAAMVRIIGGADCMVAQRLSVPVMRALARTRTRRIYDLYAAAPFEGMALNARQGGDRVLEATLRLDLFTLKVALQTGDAFVCASERQRDLWIGALLELGRIDATRFEEDPSLHDLVDVVPFGVDVEPPRASKRVLKGVVPGIAQSDRVLLWPGGIWNWFDPLTVIDAVGELSRRRDDVRLVFLGLRHPNPNVPEMRITAAAIERAERLGLRDRAVFFREGWVPYGERGAYLLEADLGVSAHFDDLETHFAFRTRLMDCIWAGLPLVTTVGDAIGDLVAERGLGRAVPSEDVGAWVEALDALLGDARACDDARAAIADVRADFLWPRAVDPLRRLVRGEGVTVPRRRSAPATRRWMLWRVRHAVANRGVTGAAARFAHVARRRALRRAVP